MRCYHLEYCTGGDIRQSGVQMLSNKDISDKTVLEGVSVLHSLVFDHEARRGSHAERRSTLAAGR